MNSTDVQGSKVYIADIPTTAWVDCAEVQAGLLAGAEALCSQDLGELSRTRAVNELGCVSSNNSVKAAGKISYGDFQMSFLFDQTDILGQDVLVTAMDNNTAIMLGIVSSDDDIIFTKALVTTDTVGFPDGSKMSYDVTVSPYDGFHRCGAGAIVPKNCALSIGGLSGTGYNLAGFLYPTCKIFGA